MSEPLEIGDTLKGAREAKGWTVQDAANKLRLMVRQVEAMETEDYGALGQPVFARGFVRNYAKLLGIDPEPMLTRMAESGAAPAEKVETEPYSPETPSVLSPVLIGALVTVLLLLAVPTALYWWLNTGEEEEPLAAPAAAAKPAILPAQPASAPAATEAMPLAGAGMQTGQVPQVVVSSAEPVAPAPAKPVAPPAPVDKPATVAPSEAALPKPQNTPFSAPEAAAPVVQDNPYLPSNFRNKSIRLQFDEDAWVQIRDANGRTIHSMLNKAGSTVDLAGKPPFEFVIGNASQVRMVYSGRAFDLKPYIGETVARFTLE